MTRPEIKDRRVFTLELTKGIPDPGDVGLSARCGGDTRARAFEAAGQILRVVGAFPAGSVRVGLYLEFDPRRRREQRTRVRLVGLCRDENDTSTARALELLFRAGPWEALYGSSLRDVKQDPDEMKNPDWLGLAVYRHCERILRREEWQPVQAALRETNHRLGQLETYYAIHPFKPRQDQDWLGVDRLFDQLQNPALIEVLVGPHNGDALREAQFAYAFLVNQINAPDSPLDRHLAEEVRRKVLTDLQPDPQADYFSKLNEELAETLRQPQLLFDLRCWSADPVEGRLLASLVAEECFEEGSYQQQVLASDSVSLQRARSASLQLSVVPSALRPLVPVGDEDPRGDAQERLKPLAQLSMVAPSDQLLSLFRLPVAQTASAPRTLSLGTDPEPCEVDAWTADGQPTQDASFLIGEDLEVAPAALTAGVLAATPSLDPYFRNPHAERAEIRLERKLLQKHLFVCGVPGSGKTTAMFNFVVQLYYHGTPFLIIEPAKTEYRMFKRFRDHPDARIRRLATEMRVFTIGEERISPLRFNPMIRDADVTIEEHRDTLMACFKASIPIDGPLEGILQEALSEVLNSPPVDRQPRLSDLVTASLKILQAKGYDSEITGNLRAALEVRLGLLTKGSLGQVLECDENVPSREQLFGAPVVLEMDTLKQDNACLMTLLVLTALRQHLRSTSRSGSPLRHVVFLEEAHNIAGRSGEGADGADPRKFAAEYIARMLAEVRALGEGMIIADQLPSAVAPEVVKNTGSKLALRLVANDDREELGGTMLLDEAGIAELARCSVGTGFFYREKYYRPRRVQTLNSHALLSATRQTKMVDGKSVPVLAEFEPPDRSQLIALLESDAWFQEGRRQREVAAWRSKWLNAEAEVIGKLSPLQTALAGLLEARTAWKTEMTGVALRGATVELSGALGAANLAAEQLMVTMDEALRTYAEAAENVTTWRIYCALTLRSQRKALGPWSALRIKALGLLNTTEAVLGDERTLPVEKSLPDSPPITLSDPPSLEKLSALLSAQGSVVTGALREFSEGDRLSPQFEDWPEFPDDRFSAEDAQAWIDATIRALYGTLQRADALSQESVKIAVALNYTNPRFNPVLNFDPAFRKNSAGMRERLSEKDAIMRRIQTEYLDEIASASRRLRDILLGEESADKLSD